MVPSKASNPKSPKIPAVNTERCIGCGACENLCPAHPFSAIYVEGYETHQTISNLNETMTKQNSWNKRYYKSNGH